MKLTLKKSIPIIFLVLFGCEGTSGTFHGDIVVQNQTSFRNGENVERFSGGKTTQGDVEIADGKLRFADCNFDVVFNAENFDSQKGKCGCEVGGKHVQGESTAFGSVNGATLNATISVVLGKDGYGGGCSYVVSAKRK